MRKRNNLMQCLICTLILIMGSIFPALAQQYPTVGDTLCGGVVVSYNPLTANVVVLNLQETTSKNWDDANSWAAGLTTNGYTDWRQPDLDELQSLYTNKDTINGALNLISGAAQLGTAWYWSSSEPSANFAWDVNFGNGSVFSDDKSNNYAARAVRAFQLFNSLTLSEPAGLVATANSSITNSIIYGNIESDNNTSANLYNNGGAVTYTAVENTAPAGTGNTTVQASDFVNAGVGNYRLKPSSALCRAADAASISKNFITDLDGNHRTPSGMADIGAYQTAKPIMPDNNGILYVNKNVESTAYNGSSWQHALSELSHALKAAETLNKLKPDSIQQIWVAQGTYTPLYRAADSVRNSSGKAIATTTARDRAFVLPANVKLYGGFHGTETDLSQRFIRHSELVEESKTILSGIISSSLGGGQEGAGSFTDTAYHVVIAAGNTATDHFYLDGFTITGGNANGNNKIKVNENDIVQHSGGGLHLFLSGNMELNNTVITGNAAKNEGGGVVCASGNFKLNNNLISRNKANKAGGMLIVVANAVVTNNTIVHNTAATSGGGLDINNSTLILNNTLLWGNAAADATDHINKENSSAVQLNYSMVENVSADDLNQGSSVYTQGFNNLEGVYNAATNPQAHADSLFLDFANNNYHLRRGSMVIDQGCNDSISVSISTDLDGKPRMLDKTTGETTLARADIGAYEYSWGSTALEGTVIYNGQLQQANVKNIPSELAGSYTDKGQAVGPNAGTYPYKAILVPKAYPGDSLVLEGTVQITKAPAALSWNTTTGTWNNDTCTFTYNGNQQTIQAAVTPSEAGTATITYYKEGETTPLAEVPTNAGRYDIKAELNSQNYSTSSIEGKLIIINPSAELEGIQVNNTNVSFTGNDISYTLPCGSPQSIPVQLTLPAGASVQGVSATNFNLDIPLFGGTLSKTFTVKSQDESTTKNYTLNITRPLNMDSIATELWDNTLMLELNNLKAQSITPTAYQWYNNNVAISGATKAFYSAGDERTHTLQGNYSVELSLQNGTKLRSCGKTLTNNKALQVKVYPNPVKAGEKLTIEIEEANWEGAQVEIYNTLGKQVHKGILNNQQVTSPSASGVYMIRLINSNGESKEMKIMVQ